MSDANYPSDVLLMHGTGVVGASLQDLSRRANQVMSYGVSVAATHQRNGANTAFFDGSATYLAIPSMDAFVFGTGDFTVEMWAYLSSLGATTRVLADWRPDGVTSSTTRFALAVASTGELAMYDSVRRITGPTFTLNAWAHVALCRASGVTRMFVNGVFVGTEYTDTTSWAMGTNRITIGGSAAAMGTQVWNGSLSDIRFAKGVARYPTTASFTPPSNITKLVSGTILDDAGNGCIRTVRAYPRTYGVPCVEIASSAAGLYTLNMPDVECGVLVLDDSAGTLYNDVYARVVPV